MHEWDNTAVALEAAGNDAFWGSSHTSPGSFCVLVRGTNPGLSRPAHCFRVFRLVNQIPWELFSEFLQVLQCQLVHFLAARGERQKDFAEGLQVVPGPRCAGAECAVAPNDVSSAITVRIRNFT
jgi:hypothetical protein